MANTNWIAKFESFLKKHKVEGEGEYTHTAFGPPWGKYNIGDSDIDRFLALYKRVIGQIDLHITEKPKDVGPLLFDLDFKFDKKHNERQYLDTHLEYIVKKTTNKLKKYFSVKNKDLQAFVFEKEEPTYEEKNSNYKDGFHIIYPHIGVPVEIRYLLLDEIRNEVIAEEGFSDIPHNNDMDDVFDKAVIKRNGWMMYSSRKYKCQQYNLTHIYAHDMTEQRLDSYDKDELVVLLCVRRHDEEERIKLRDSENTAEMKKKISDVTDKYLSQGKKKNSNKEESPQNASKIENKINKINAKPKLDSDIQMAKKLIKMLSPKRADSYHTWVVVGWAAHNVDDSLLEDFIEFSKSTTKKGAYQEGCCEKIWDRAKDYGYTIASLHLWARQDNPAAYLEFARDGVNKLILEAESGAHDDIAKVVYELYKHEFKCVSIKKNIWYEFQQHRWAMVDSAYTLANKLSDEVTGEFARLASQYYAEIGNKDSEGKLLSGLDKETKLKKANSVVKIVEKLKNEGFKTAILGSCAHRFYDAKFEEKLDDNPDLLGFDNGIYDLEHGCFRAGSPDDNITLSVGYDYVNYKKDDPEIKEVKDFFKTVQREEEMRNYILNLVSSYMDGHNKQQKFILWTGSGCHNKDTEILMANGTKKKIQDIQLNDYVMGDDSRPRKVKVLFTGEQDMYRVKMSNGDSFVVNKSHRLALRSHFTNTINRIDEGNDDPLYELTWHEYIESIPMHKSKTFRSFEEAEKYSNKLLVETENVIYQGMVLPIKIDDYLLMEDKVKAYYKCYSNPITYAKKATNHDPYEFGLSEDLSNIPDELLISDIETRRKLLAGIIDRSKCNNKNSYTIDKNPKLIDLIRSLGYYVTVSDKLTITGYNLDKLPVKINRIEQADDLVEELTFDLDMTLEKVEREPFYGMELDGNKRYVMGNYMVTYNSNGKSTAVDLIKYTLGEYFGILPITVLTRKRGAAGNATPELADKRGKRCLVIQEPEHDDVIYVGFMKELTGSDWIQARALYGDPFEYKPQFKLLLTCNKLPHIPSTDGGTWRRLRVSPWESEFVDGKPEHPHQFPKDPMLGEKLKRWNAPFSWIILNEHYQDFRKNGIKEPKKVTQFTEKYKKDSDIYYEFLIESYELTKKEKDFEFINTVFSAFKVWYKEAYSANNPARKEFINYLTNKDYKVEDGKVYGIKMRGVDMAIE
jgi:phage/plasmid-associated DNA primase